MKNASIVEFLGTLSLQSVIIFLVLLLVFAVAVYFICKAVSNNKEKKQKENASTLGVKNAGKFFKIMKLDPKNSGIVFLSFDPSRNYPSGEGGGWFSSLNIPKELVRESQVLEVLKVTDTEVKVVGHALF